MPTLLSDVRCWGQSGKHLLGASISPFDPSATLGPDDFGDQAPRRSFDHGALGDFPSVHLAPKTDVGHERAVCALHSG
jgi:hypothetical protein